MKAVSIVVNYPPVYVQDTVDRDFIKVGQVLAGYVTLDEPGRPKRMEIRWRDARGRLLGVTGGKYEAYNRRVHFEFKVRHNPFWLHWIECEIDGRRQDATAPFAVSPTTQGWETMPAIAWAVYPEGEFHDRLQEVGVNAEIAFKRNHFEHVAGHGMRFYVDNSTPDEISVYHRPHRLFWEPPEDAVGPFFAWGRGYRDNWSAIRARYLRMRARAAKDGVKISRDPHYRKVLWRDFCPNAPGARKEAIERLEAVVRQHKGFRPLFYNMADEAGITDQNSPFDYCYCPWCMDQFRRVLEKKYETLDRLNDVWGTRFDTWDDVYPLTTDETMDARRRGQPLRLASWNDHRAFMDDTFSEFFRIVREAGRHWDPIGDFGHGGCQAPSAFGGWDYAKIVRTVDTLIPYYVGGNREVIRSLRPRLKNLTPFFGDDERLIRGIWDAYIQGDAGVVFWDADEKTGRFVARPSGKPSRRGRRFGPALREIRGGFAQQWKTWKRTDEPIGLLYSQPSLRAHWMLHATASRGKSNWLDAYRAGHYPNTRKAWQQLIEDRQLQYRYFSYLDVDEGMLDLSQFRLIVLPEAIAVSHRLATALHDFVADGGVLVADGRAGRMDEDLNQVDTGMLDGLFGIRHGSSLTLRPGAKLKLASTGDGKPWIDLDRAAGGVQALDSELRIREGSGATALAWAGKAPALVSRQVGKGRAVYLNADIRGYFIDRFDLDGPAAAFRHSLLDAVVRLAGIEPAFTVTDRTLTSPAGIRSTRFRQGGAEMLVMLMNREYKISGVGEKLAEDTLESFEVDRRLTIDFPTAACTYNSRSGEYLGKTAQVSQTLPRLTPLILSRLPYRVRKLEATVPRKVKQGDEVVIEFGIDTGDRQALDHVVRVDVTRPDGQWAYWYSGTPVARGGVGSWTFPLAHDAAKGVWKVTLRDIVTGTQTIRSLRVV